MTRRGDGPAEVHVRLRRVLVDAGVVEPRVLHERLPGRIAAGVEGTAPAAAPHPGDLVDQIARAVGAQVSRHLNPRSR